MIAVCPKCSARYRVEPTRIGPEGAKLRCTKCSALFLVRVPAAGSGASTGVEQPISARPTPMAAAAPAAAPPVPRPADAGAARWVLVADADEARGKASVEAIRSFGLAAELVHDGVEAMLAIQRRLPQAVVLDVGLPRMYGFQVCEIVKRNESLKGTTVVLVGSVHDPSRYRREPVDLYGADVYLEPADLPDGLRPILRDRGLLTGAEPVARTAARVEPPMSVSRPVAAAPVAPAPPPPRMTEPSTAPAPLAAPAPMPSATATADPAATAGDPARAEERERARRLARIAVSEMVLYQPEKFAQAAREGTLERALEMEIQEARALIRQRIGPEVRAEADFVLEELQRVARERGAKA
ncbi:MAG: zinc-ribbon domain-containing protein [Myxococcota bacterium]